MSTKATDRRAKIEAAAPSSRGGANKIVVATVVAVLAIAAIVIGVIVADQGKKADLAAGGSALPKDAAAMGAGLVANPSAPASAPTLDLWVDFQCPACAAFEKAFGDQLVGMTKANDVKLVVHVLSFLDKTCGNDSSNRAANAAACAATRVGSSSTSRRCTRASPSRRARATPTPSSRSSPRPLASPAPA